MNKKTKIKTYSKWQYETEEEKKARIKASVRKPVPKNVKLTLKPISETEPFSEGDSLEDFAIPKRKSRKPKQSTLPRKSSLGPCKHQDDSFDQLFRDFNQVNVSKPSGDFDSSSILSSSFEVSKNSPSLFSLSFDWSNATVQIDINDDKKSKKKYTKTKKIKSGKENKDINTQLVSTRKSKKKKATKQPKINKEPIKAAPTLDRTKSPRIFIENNGTPTISEQFKSKLLTSTPAIGLGRRRISCIADALSPVPKSESDLFSDTFQSDGPFDNTNQDISEYKSAQSCTGVEPPMDNVKGMGGCDMTEKSGSAHQDTPSIYSSMGREQELSRKNPSFLLHTTQDDKISMMSQNNQQISPISGANLQKSPISGANPQISPISGDKHQISQISGNNLQMSQGSNSTDVAKYPVSFNLTDILSNNKRRPLKEIVPTQNISIATDQENSYIEASPEQQTFSLFKTKFESTPVRPSDCFNNENISRAKLKSICTSINISLTDSFINKSLSNSLNKREISALKRKIRHSYLSNQSNASLHSKKKNISSLMRRSRKSSRKMHLSYQNSKWEKLNYSQMESEWSDLDINEEKQLSRIEKQKALSSQLSKIDHTNSFTVSVNIDRSFTSNVCPIKLRGLENTNQEWELTNPINKTQENTVQPGNNSISLVEISSKVSKTKNSINSQNESAIDFNTSKESYSITDKSMKSMVNSSHDKSMKSMVKTSPNRSMNSIPNLSQISTTTADNYNYSAIKYKNQTADYSINTSIAPKCIPNKGWKRLTNAFEVPSKRFLNYVDDGLNSSLPNYDLQAQFITCSLARLSLQRQSILHVQKVLEHNEKELEPKDHVLSLCVDNQVLPLSQCFSPELLSKSRKIGEGVYGEVFMSKEDPNLKTMKDARVFKIMPIEGMQEVNGEPQKKFHEIVSEILISVELSNLRLCKDINYCENFVDVIKCWCLQGEYEPGLLELWDKFDQDKGSENDRPSMFTSDQHYIVLEFAHGGRDLESFVFNSAEQSLALFLQIAYGLAVAERQLEFEHRDLHWGNVLVAETDEKNIKYKFGEHEYTIPSKGVKATIIDFTLSRLKTDHCVVYNNLGQDPTLFQSEGDYQFDIYRMMKQATANDWEKFCPKTNIFWLHYILDKMITDCYYKKTNTKIHQINISKLKKLKNEIMNYDSCGHFVHDREFSWRKA